MIPYGSFIFFFLIGIFLLPTIVLGLLGKSSKIYNMLVSIVILAVIFGNSKTGAISIILFTIFQIVLIKGYHHYRKERNNTVVFCMMVVLAILPLVLVKVLPLLGLNHVFGFLGVSYITFKSVQIVIETRDGMMKKQTLPIGELIYFLLFFPTVSSGPIDRWRRFEKDVNKTFSKEEYKELLYLGINSIFRGFLYKFILAFLIYNKILVYLPDHATYIHSPFWANVAYMYTYSFYLFFDFAGYSAFAIGVSYLMGVKTPENFNMPFISKNIKDFWNRWHMSLSFWFRDYVYMRFVFWMTKKKWIKNRYTVSNIGYFLLFFIMGVWHGLEWHFIIYGLYQAALIIGYDYFDRWNRKHKLWPKNKFTHVVSVFITFNFICFGFYIFSGQLFK
ncbi:D-alanyl-lipoteichoic acid biosynthesis protein DltB [Viridibacillus arvi]|jgi:membrane protein involved in D-alanine export|uniref:Teichoic acid D-alanyltransferase n=1 Tax=Viridibacillus arvi TaxID=263475 RepID=A0A0M0LAY9_9BACL|nr:D-alanyl-lipoteichoic acid biosynthesis protein DltB [Viridibacillus arvi]KOO48226.1 alanine transporter [Viridibacillus arvi]